MNELEKAKSEFWANHKARMALLDQAIDSLQKITDSESIEKSNKELEEIAADLEALLQE